MNFYNLWFLGVDTKAPIMEKHVSSVKEFSDLMDNLKSSGKDPSKLELILICGNDRGSDEYLTELNYGKQSYLKNFGVDFLSII